MGRPEVSRKLAVMLPVVLALWFAACTRPPASSETADSALQAAPVEVPVGAEAMPTPALFRGRGQLRIAGRTSGPVLQVELARSPLEREQGLMYRRSLPDGNGMLFFMPDQRPWRFWMRNTLIPLDMIFIDEDWRVAGVVARAAPLTETGRGVAEPSRYVLELGAGQAEALHIERGTILEFRELAGEVGQP